MVLEIYRSMAKVFDLKVRKFWGFGGFKKLQGKNGIPILPT